MLNLCAALLQETVGEVRKRRNTRRLRRKCAPFIRNLIRSARRPGGACPRHFSEWGRPGRRKRSFLTYDALTTKRGSFWLGCNALRFWLSLTKEKSWPRR